MSSALIFSFHPLPSSRVATQQRLLLLLLLVAVYLAAVPFAMLNERPDFRPNWGGVVLTQLLALALGAGLYHWMRTHPLERLRLTSNTWLGMAFLVALLPNAWPPTMGRHQYFGIVDPVLAALPFYASWIVTLAREMTLKGVQDTWKAALSPAFKAGVFSAMTAISLPSWEGVMLPFLLLLTRAHPALNRAAWICIPAMILIGLYEQMVHLGAGKALPVAFGWYLDDPYGTVYQLNHARHILTGLNWFGAEPTHHLPLAAGQLLPLGIGQAWGGVVMFLALALCLRWLFLTRPATLAPTATGEVARLQWLGLLFQALVGLASSLAIMPPFGPGMPILGGNPALTVLACIVMAGGYATDSAEATMPQGSVP